MSEQQAEYRIAPATDNQAKAQSVSITLNSEQVLGVIHGVMQKSPKLIVAEALRVLACSTDALTMELLSENDAQIIMQAIVTMYPEMSRRVIDNMDNV